MPTSMNPFYMLLGLGEEVGELMGKFSKAVRKGKIKVHIEYAEDFVGEERQEFEDLVKKELGDVMWMTAGVSNIMGFTNEEVAQANIDKLASRHQRNVIDGEGDNR